MIRVKYKVEEGGWFTKTPMGCAGSNPWKDISKESKQVQQFCVFVFGDGNRIKLWEDFWCGEGPLRETFPDLYILVESKGVKAAALWDKSRGEGVWNHIFARPFNDWELEEVLNYMILVNKSRINQETSDNIVWKGDKKGLYSVRANSALIEGSAGRTTPWKILWNNLVAPKVWFFA